MKVLKFGGTSVGTPERMEQVYSIIKNEPGRKIVVLSAVSGTTNSLVEIGEKIKSGDRAKARKLVDKLYNNYESFVKKLYPDLTYQDKAQSFLEDKFAFVWSCIEGNFNDTAYKVLLAQGELISTQLFTYYLQSQAHQAILLPALSFMQTDTLGEPALASIKENLGSLLAKYDEKHDLFITQGYICHNAEGQIDNLQRGGSDYTASLIGEAINADEIQIWTDIDGMHNNDPRVVEDTFAVPHLSFNEAAELAYFGAKILHPSCIWPAQRTNIPVLLKNTMLPTAKGTRIDNQEEENGAIKAIAAKENIAAIKIKSIRMLLAYGFLRRVFEVFEKYKTPIDMITTSEVAVSLTIDNTYYLDSIINELKPYGDIEVDRNQTILCIVGNMVADKKGIIQGVFDALGDIPVRMISYGGSRHNISLLVDSNYKKEALKALNKGLFQVA